MGGIFFTWGTTHQRDEAILYLTYITRLALFDSLLASETGLLFERNEIFWEAIRKFHTPSFPVMMTEEEKVTQSNEALNDNGAAKEPQASTASHKRWHFFLVGVVFFSIVFALALGLGLGLGLKHHNNSALAAAPSATLPASSPVGTPTTSGTPTPGGTPSSPLQPWRLDTLDYNLDLSWNVSAPPTTRIFNLTLSEIEAAPDGEFLHTTMVH